MHVGNIAQTAYMIRLHQAETKLQHRQCRSQLEMNTPANERFKMGLCQHGVLVASLHGGEGNVPLLLENDQDSHLIAD